MVQHFYEPPNQYYDEIGEYDDDDGNYYDAEGTPLHNNLHDNLRNSASYHPYLGGDSGARHDLEPFDRLDRRNYNHQNSISERQSSQNWSSSNQSFSTFQQHQRPPPLLEGFDDDEGPWTDEGITDGKETKVGKGYTSKANGLKWKIFLAVSIVAVGAIGGIVYWTTLKGSPSAVSANSGANAGATDTRQPDGSQGSGNSTNIGGDNGTNVNFTVIEPPQSFEVTCSRKSVTGDSTNFQHCEVMCGQAVCCYVGDNETATGFDSCFEENKEICDLYSPFCDFLFGPLILSSNPANNTSVSAIQPAPGDLLTSCGTNGSVAECMDACYDGYCCFSSAPAIMDGANQTSPSCYEQSVCEGYLPCLAVVLSSLSPTNETDELPNPPDDLSELCSEDSLTTQVGAVLCMSHCSKALCCIDVNASNTCIDENIAKCTRYSPCSRILQGMLTDDVSNVEVNQTADKRMPLPPPELAEVCNPDYFALVENRTACAFECEAALCCYNDVGGCLQDELETCLAYFPCQALVDYLGDGGNLTTPSANLTTNCDAESRATKAGRTECLKDCFPGLCCYHPKNSCFEDNIFTCLAYSPCEPIIDLDDGTFKGIVPLLNTSLNNTTASEVAPPPQDLLDLCSLESLSSVKGVAACFGACTASMCCISDDENCYDSNSKNCDLYEPCLNLLYSPVEADNASSTTGVSLDPPPDDLDSMCDPDRAFTSQKCRLACEAAACCFRSDSSCRRKQSRWCASYSPCEVFQNASGDPINNTIVRKLCKPTAFEENDKPCKNVCREGGCCFVNASDSASCADNNGFCEYYKPCSILNGEKAHEQLNTTNKTVSVSKACNVDALLNDTEVREKCVDACHGWECCFLDRNDKRSCHKDVAFCKEYTPCLALSAFTNVSISLEQVCVPSNGKFSDAHNMACTSLCKAGRCCLITKGDPDSCAHKTDFCGAFDACAVLSESKPSASPSLMSSTGNTARNSSQSLAPSVSPSPTTVNDTSILIRKICNKTNTSSGAGREECLGVCLEGSCCFLDEMIPESCANETDFCADYQPCALLVVVDPDNSTSGGGSNSVHRACSDDSLSTPSGVSKCTALCEEGSCCREPTHSADSCRSDTDFCIQFKSCKSLAAWNDANPSVANATGKRIATTEGPRYPGDPPPK